MSWLLNLFMVGKGPPPNKRSFTVLSVSATPGKPQTFVAKTAAEVTAVSPWYYFRFIGQMGV